MSLLCKFGLHKWKYFGRYIVFDRTYFDGKGHNFKTVSKVQYRICIRTKWGKIDSFELGEGRIRGYVEVKSVERLKTIRVMILKERDAEK